MTTVISYAIIEEVHRIVPDVRLNPRQMVLIVVLASTAGVGSQYAVALLTSFPVPFGLAVNMPAWALSMAGLVFLCVGDLTPQNTVFRTRSKIFFMVFLSQIALTLIYSVYIYGLVSMREGLRWVYMLLLPVIKIATKNYITWSMGDLDDMKPEIVVFNIEILNALYVSCSMQSAGPLSTSLMLTALDLIHRWLPIRGVDELVTKIAVLMTRIPEKGRAYSGENCLEIALLIIDEDAIVKHHSSLQRVNVASSIRAGPQKRSITGSSN